MFEELEKLSQMTIDHGVRYFRRAQAEEVLKLIAVARAAKESDLYGRHMDNCRHEYRHCTCGRDELVKALEEITD